MNALFFAKVLISAVIIGVATEVAKRYPFWGAVIIALPLTSILAMGWLYAETSDNVLVTKFARDIFLVVPVSLVFFVPFLLETRTRLGFVSNMLIGLALLAVSVWLLRRFVP
ncbi:MAG: hypothetical protein A3E57_02005 [Candidatus Muproteobacteria bacterium RIFCSPHIGHO2_12_FULL_60_33]|uniref:DUF3147 family protein n=1 Tax=Candidatus Muproteobacteria bacterium RIFCSPLOWO2_01_FULL_60_18 TaxID=1817768 RepID=A0A1F6U114_9PROT|nr:MAG: hypothetical protein A2W42_07725 [Candidatus Muproteobacteria bacterium RIFCSPHIGHO2_01_60_12]OGI51068.1 MAG: hypothetical protein A3A87_00060 [Candidatus Muproteobacteria bacterium RIFCSPLOWO2_01_FULL_60_18]OGI54628.1 MAG: hypothetical protein A3D32_03910 [Candidatus Muproteobacteria bacterium RIFCSPHIGHO2_02_FULL_60_13]OGI56140.1 MAG: hypothetical protein A3E57_02005 [Candidatus Muproteobacteria bacterium RIFCSPHIGHO2_12_FULL_60_33]OGI58854.1 MAG: hypothetical protein A2809_04215 [Can